MTEMRNNPLVFKEGSDSDGFRSAVIKSINPLNIDKAQTLEKLIVACVSMVWEGGVVWLRANLRLC